MNFTNRAYCDRILRVDLSTGKIWTTPLPEKEMPLLLGGKGLGAWLLYHEQPAHVDPLAPENQLIFHTGPLTGTTAPTAGRFGVTTKSPATHTYFDAYCGGYWGQMLKYAGYDALIVTGRAPSPVLIYIEEDEISIRPADHLWGTTISQATEKIWAEYGRHFQSLVIGPPGENQRNVAGIFNESRALARGGVGAVMGAKNLKAIAVHGQKGVRVHDKPRFERALQLAFRAVRMSSQTVLLSQEGTANILEIIDVMGALPTRNFQRGQFEHADQISGYAFRQNNWKKEYACFGCPIGCGKWTAPLDDGTVIEGPEYETIYAFGPNCAIGSREAIIKLNWYCDEYGMDTISTGGVIGFVMEMFEKGIISAAELDGIEPVFGDIEAALALIDKMAKVEGCGHWLAQGVAAIARRFASAESFAMHVKGLELPAYHPNAAKGTALAYAVSERGACHLRGAPLGELFSGSADPLALEGKPQLFRDHQAEKAAWDSAALCIFPAYGMSLKELWQLVTAATGFEYPTTRDLERVGERISTLARLFNIREGLARAHDTLPQRSLTQPMNGGPANGHIVELDPMLDEYYRLMGWDQNGIPTEQRLQELELV
ncbi:MAG: aldehyde ferredoxin oxidoreductase family protein [Candidatus Promineifilaceae bacterium]|nr:aldehyde ferredoxin oxidoreductase family protein [Candidatus Promineifilaceae bacterium]